MVRNIKERIAMLSEFDDVIETLTNSIKMYENWANEDGTTEDVRDNYLFCSMIKTNVRDMIIKLADSV